MKILFFSSDHTEVDLVCNEFMHAGIPYEVRTRAAPGGLAQASSDAELWIQNDRDWYRASMLCVALSIGLAKRAEEHDKLAA